MDLATLTWPSTGKIRCIQSTVLEELLTRWIGKKELRQVQEHLDGFAQRNMSRTPTSP